MQIRLLVNTLVLCLTLVSVLVVNPTRSVSVLQQFDVRQRQAGRLSYDPDDRDAMLAQASPCANGHESGLPLPSGFAPANLPVFQAQLKLFLKIGRAHV